MALLNFLALAMVLAALINTVIAGCGGKTCPTGTIFCSSQNIFLQDGHLHTIGYMFSPDEQHVEVHLFDQDCNQLASEPSFAFQGSKNLEYRLKDLLLITFPAVYQPPIVSYRGMNLRHADGFNTNCYNIEKSQACEYQFGVPK